MVSLASLRVVVVDPETVLFLTVYPPAPVRIGLVLELILLTESQAVLQENWLEELLFVA